MRILTTSLVVIINFILQSTLFEYIEIIGIIPNTAIIIIVSYAMLRDDVEGAIIGFFSGLLQDMFFGRVIGLYAFLGMITGYLCGKPFKDYYNESYILPLILVVASVIGYEFVFYCTSFLFRGKIDIIYYFGNIIFPESAYTAILTLPVYRIVYVVNTKVLSYEKKKRKLF